MTAWRIFGLVVAVEAVFFAAEIAFMAASRKALPDTIRRACLEGMVGMEEGRSWPSEDDLAYCVCLGDKATAGLTFPAWLLAPSTVDDVTMSQARMQCIPERS